MVFEDTFASEADERIELERGGSSLNKRRHWKRRDVLKGVSAATIGLPSGGSGFVQPTSAADNPPWRTDAVEAARKYATGGMIREAISTHAGDLLHALSSSGYLERPDVSELPLDIYQSVESYVESEDGVGVFGTVQNNEPKVKIQLKHQLGDERSFELLVDPESESSLVVLDDETRGLSTGASVEPSGARVAYHNCCAYWGSGGCGITCSPDGNCSCDSYEVCTDNWYDCDPDNPEPVCRVTGYDCTGCSDPIC